MLHDASFNKEKIIHALGECSAWLTTLNLLKEESYLLKNRLSEALDNNADRNLIAHAEDYHNLILVRDEYIRDIGTDVKKQEKVLKDALQKNHTDKFKIKQQEKLRNEITYLQKDFASIREAFYREFTKIGS